MTFRIVLLTSLIWLAWLCSASAQIQIDDARISRGDLFVSGRAHSNSRVIVLDSKYEATIDRRGRFEFRVTDIPASCIGILTAGSETRRIVIANCGPKGDIGPPGPKGESGPQGAKGDTGPPGAASNFGMQVYAALSGISVVFYLGSLLVYLWFRPSWRNIGPSLLDAFVIGVALFASGSILVWLLTSIEHAREVMTIGLAAGISGNLGAAFWSYIYRSRIKSIHFLGIVREIRAGTGVSFAITIGLFICALVSIWFLIQVYSHQHIRSLLYAAVFQGKATLTEARLLISSGTEGYFAPGYVKQFRDIFIPILTSAALLCSGKYRNRWVFYGSLILALISMFVTGQRLIVIQLMLCVAAAFILDYVSHGPSKLMPIPLAIPSAAVLIGAVLVMTQMLGRLDIPLTPTANTAPPPVGVPGIRAPTPKPRVEPKQESLPERPKQESSAEAASGQELTEVKTKQRSFVTTVVDVMIALAHRSVMAAPQENAFSYEYWAPQAPSWGRGWLVELASVRPGTQKQISNELSEANLGGNLGNSPLAQPADLYYNWGLAGVILFSIVYPLGYLLLDIFLTGSRSPLLLAGKIFLFFSVPLMYSPFLFILYGGAAVAALCVYTMLLRLGVLSFLGLRE